MSDHIIQEQIFGQSAIDRYDHEAPVVQLSKFIGKGLYQECSRADAEKALEYAKGLGDLFVLSNPEKAVMLTSWGYPKGDKIRAQNNDLGIW